MRLSRWNAYVVAAPVLLLAVVLVVWLLFSMYYTAQDEQACANKCGVSADYQIVRDQCLCRPNGWKLADEVE